MEANILKPKKAHGTRWVQHRLEACHTIIRSYDVLVAHLEFMANDPTHDRAKMIGIHRKLTSLKFVCHLLFLEKVLLPVSRLSLAWQKDSVEIPQLLSCERNLRETLPNMAQVEAQEMGALDCLIRKATAVVEEGDYQAGSSPITFKGVLLTEKHTLGHFQRSQKDYVESLIKCLEVRFCLADDGKASILDTCLWPKEPTKLREYGNEKIKMVASHFKNTLTLVSKSSSTETEDTAPACAGDENVPQQLLEEWQHMKIFISQHFLEQEPKEIWEKNPGNVHTSLPDYGSNYQHFEYLSLFKCHSRKVFLCYEKNQDRLASIVRHRNIG